MNVLVVTNMYPTEKNPFYGIFVKEQVDSLRNEGVSIDVFFINGKESRLNYFTRFIDLVRTIKCRQYDIIHAHHTYCIFPTKIAKTISGLRSPLILTFHEGEVNLKNDLGFQHTDLIKRLVFSKRIKCLAFKMVDLVITVQDQIIKKLNFKGNSLNIPCGVNSDLFKPLEQKWCRKMLNLPFDKKIIFFPAAPINKQKGFNILKESMEYLGREDLYLITGGNIKHEEMPLYMNAADVVVQLSLFEASPSVLKEALAVNVPLVFTDAGDAKMITKNLQGCFLCERTPKDVASKINKALSFDETCNGRERIFKINLTLNKISEKLIAVYNDMLL